MEINKQKERTGKNMLFNFLLFSFMVFVICYQPIETIVVCCLSF